MVGPRGKIVTPLGQRKKTVPKGSILDETKLKNR